jgi:hypothetical protein
VFRCPDRLGVLSKLTELTALNAGKLESCDMHIGARLCDPGLACADCGARAEVDNATATSEFHSRTVFTYDAAAWPREKARLSNTKLWRARA